MNTTIDNICYEYADDVMFSQDIDDKGNPLKIIIYVQDKYLVDLSRFLKNYNYSITHKKVMGRHFVLITFCTYQNNKIKKRGLTEDI
jgi:hypothetical protein